MDKITKSFINLMESFLLEEEDGARPYFDPKQIYRTYYAIWLGQQHEDDRETEFVISSVSRDLREYYLEQYLVVVRTQLKKYFERGRVDKDFDSKLIKSKDFHILNVLMNKTYRSDMKRRNDRWNMLTQYLEDLQKIPKGKAMDQLLKMDRINNTVHNTGEVMLTKFNNSRELLQALNKSSDVKDPSIFKTLAQDMSLNKLARTFGEAEEE